MVFNQYRMSIIVRILLLSLTIAGFFFLILFTNFKITTMFTGLFIALQIYGLIKFCETAMNEFDQFIQGIKLNDLTLRFPSGDKKSPLGNLRNRFNSTIGQIRELRKEGEENLHYLKTVVSHIPIGLLALENDEKISLYNASVKKIIGVSQLNHIDDISNPDIKGILVRIKPGSKVVFKTEINGEIAQLSLSATQIKQRGSVIKLVSVQNLTSELAEKEIEAWHQLVRVLTHEIMNSVTPVASLASTIHDILTENKYADLNEDQINDIITAVRAIRKRGEGLIHFVESYRGLSNIPKPNIEIIELSDLLERVKKLIISREDARGIQMTVDVHPDNLKIAVDPDLIEQVIINLAINSIHALKDTKSGYINIIATLSDRSRAVIQVIDNGPGISEEAKDKLFVPFFSTKPEGAGIGLSLSQQIMRQHHGTISVTSKPNQMTIFTLRF